MPSHIQNVSTENIQSNYGLCWAAAAVCVVGVWWSERDGLAEEGAGGGAEAQH